MKALNLGGCMASIAGRPLSVSLVISAETIPSKQLHLQLLPLQIYVSIVLTKLKYQSAKQSILCFI